MTYAGMRIGLRAPLGGFPNKPMQAYMPWEQALGFRPVCLLRPSEMKKEGWRSFYLHFWLATKFTQEDGPSTIGSNFQEESRTDLGDWGFNVSRFDRPRSKQREIPKIGPILLDLGVFPRMREILSLFHVFLHLFSQENWSFTRILNSDSLRMCPSQNITIFYSHKPCLNVHLFLNIQVHFPGSILCNTQSFSSFWNLFPASLIIIPKCVLSSALQRSASRNFYNII